MALLNCRSVVGKIDVLRQWLLEDEFDIIILTETWLTSSLDSHELHFGSHTIIRRDRPNRPGGGIAILLRDNWRIVSTWLHDSLELLEVVAKSPGVTLHILATYIPPPITLDTLQEHLDSFSDRLATQRPGHKLIIGGDFNVHAVDTTMDLHWVSLKRFMSAWGLSRVATPPTRGMAFLDHVFTNCGAEGSAGPPPINSDHRLVTCSISIPFFKKMHYRIIMGQINWAQIQLNLSSSPTIPADNHALHIWCTQLAKAIHKATEKIRIPSHCPAWVTVHSTQQFKIVRQALHHFRTNPTESNRVLRNRERAVLRRCLREDKKIFLADLAKCFRKGSPKALWAACRPYRDIGHHNTIQNSPQQLTALTNFYRTKFSNTSQACNWAQREHTVAPTGYLLQIDICLEREVEVVLSRWRNLPLISAGNLGKGALAAEQLNLCSPLTALFNCWIKTASYPDTLKEVTITPLLKCKASPGDPGSYRPIAKSSAMAVCFESVIANKLAIEVSSKLHDAQHGFRNKRSTTTNLLAFWTSVSDALDAGREVHCIFLDIQGAFDSVPHDALLHTLDHLGLCAHSLSLVQSFLNNRSGTVLWEGRRGDSFPILRGVPQGSPLGPLLFAIYTNALLFLLDDLDVEMICYADDLKVWKSISSPSDSLKLQEALDAATYWCQDHGLRLNPMKSSVMAFASKKAQRYPANYCIERQQIPIVSSIRDLGVVFQADGHFHMQAAKVIAAAHRTAGLVKRLCRTLDLPDGGLVLFNALVLSKIEYAAAVWWPWQQYWRHSIDSILTRFLRVMYCRKMRISFDRLIPSNLLLQSFNADRPSERRKTLDLRLLIAILRGDVHCRPVLHRISWRIPPRATRLQPWLDPGRCRVGIREHAFVHRACRSANDNPSAWDF